MIRRSGARDINSVSVDHGGLVYLSGIIPDDLSADITGQTREVLNKIETHLRDAGTDKSKLLTATVFITDVTNREKMNAVWKEWVDPQNLPARATVGVTLAPPQLLIEISVIAAK